MKNISRIHWHDSVILRVIEIPKGEKLLFEVDYPVDWEAGKYEIHVIEFSGIYTYQINEGPFSGAITILDLTILESEDQYGASTLRMETNAGYRTIKCKNVELVEGNYKG